jgi:hypothetical protein
MGGLISGLICPTVCPKQAVDLLGDVVPEVWRQVLVARGHGVGGPAHKTHHGALADPEDEQHGRGVLGSNNLSQLLTCRFVSGE